ncbi:tetratricopeptide repeat protein [Pseudoalteromonas sp. MMG005]|uniref:tetratricopeptide repeat protein n=1 Tax=Pseudoalteromonas sp. MMG005 TaxID=2822682 RepID=UPI001B3A4E47|nr:tetratricopeptide repeat protein [Pseudoalteromonas sp. MMG005]MBQ4846951.1 tetratricopeptide repeat protein [Pseudoalteromonas sp. MMG005]
MRLFLLLVSLCFILLKTSSANEPVQNAGQKHIQQLSAIQTKMAVLDEQLKQQKKHAKGIKQQLGGDFKKLEETQTNLKIQLANISNQIIQQEKVLNFQLAKQEQSQNKELNVFDGRISDLSYELNFYSILITIIALILGFSTSFIAIYKAKSEANTASEKHMSEWLKNNSDELIAQAQATFQEINQELKGKFDKFERDESERMQKFSEIRQVKAKFIDSLMLDTQYLTYKSFEHTNLSVGDWLEIGTEFFSNNQFSLSIIAWDAITSNIFEEVDDLTLASALSYKSACLDKLTQPEAEIKTYDELITRFIDSEHETIQERVAAAILNKGVTQGQLNQAEEEIKTYDILIARFRESGYLEVQEQVAKAMLHKGTTQSELAQFDDAIKAYEALITQFSKSENEAVLEQVAKAMLNKGVVHGQLDQSKEEVKTYEALIAHFSESDNEAVQEQVAKAMLNKGITLGQLDQLTEEIKTYEELIAHFSESDNEAVQERVAKAMLNKGVRQSKLNRPKEEIKTYEELIAHFGESDNEVVQEKVAKAMLYIGVSQVQLNLPDDAIKTYEELICRYGDSNNPEITAIVAQAQKRLDEL